METYSAYISHHSISRAPVSNYTCKTLAAAKRKATAEFGEGFADHEIVIEDANGNILATKKIGNNVWNNRL